MISTIAAGRPATAVARPATPALLCALAAALMAPGAVARLPQLSRWKLTSGSALQTSGGALQTVGSALQTSGSALHTARAVAAHAQAEAAHARAEAAHARAVNATAPRQGSRALGLLAVLRGMVGASGQPSPCEAMTCLHEVWDPCLGKPDEMACLDRAIDSVCACREKDLKKCPQDAQIAHMAGVLEMYCGGCGHAEIELFQGDCLSEDGDHISTDIMTDCGAKPKCLPLICSYVAACPTTEQAMKDIPTLTKEDMIAFKQIEDDSIDTLQKCKHSHEGSSAGRIPVSASVNVGVKVSVSNAAA